MIYFSPFSARMCAYALRVFAILPQCAPDPIKHSAVERWHSSIRCINSLPPPPLPFPSPVFNRFISPLRRWLRALTIHRRQKSYCTEIVSTRRIVTSHLEDFCLFERMNDRLNGTKLIRFNRPFDETSNHYVAWNRIKYRRRS